MCCTEWIDWKGTKCYVYNFCSLKERNKVQHLITRLHNWAQWWVAMELMDDPGDEYIQSGPHICHHRSPALKGVNRDIFRLVMQGVISHTMRVVPRSFPSGNKSCRPKILFPTDWNCFRQKKDIIIPFTFKYVFHKIQVRSKELLAIFFYCH